MKRGCKIRLNLRICSFGMCCEELGWVATSLESNMNWYGMTFGV